MGIAILALASWLAAAEHTVLYDVQFDSPLHRVGEPPTISGAPFPRFRPTGIPGGEPTVVESVCSLNDQPVRFDADRKFIHSEVLAFEIQRDFSRYLISMDVCILGLAPSHPSGGGSGFSVFLHSRELDVIRFQSDGSVLFQRSDDGVQMLDAVIGRFHVGSSYTLQIVVDQVEKTISVRIGDGDLFISEYRGGLAPRSSFRPTEYPVCRGRSRSRQRQHRCRKVSRSAANKAVAADAQQLVPFAPWYRSGGGLCASALLGAAEPHVR